jgi:hypothetical protein
METPNADSLGEWLARHGVPERDLVRMYRTFYANAPQFRAAADGV